MRPSALVWCVLGLGIPSAHGGIFESLPSFAKDQLQSLIEKALPEPGSVYDTLLKAAAAKALAEGQKAVAADFSECVTEPQADRHLFTITPATPRPEQAVTVIFVNGIQNDEAGAKSSAQALANKFHCRVELLFNPHARLQDDLEESVKDKLWPWSSYRGPGQRIGQHNESTCQLAWLLLHCPGKIALVSHSQGCIISRNAYFVALASDPTLKDRLSWVALASPLRDFEFTAYPCSTPATFREFTHGNDLVARHARLGRSERPTSLDILHHSFEGAYLAEIELKDLAKDGL